jgi:hypothetical protein
MVVVVYHRRENKCSAFSLINMEMFSLLILASMKIGAFGL